MQATSDSLSLAVECQSGLLESWDCGLQSSNDSQHRLVSTIFPDFLLGRDRQAAEPLDLGQRLIKGEQQRPQMFVAYLGHALLLLPIVPRSDARRKATDNRLMLRRRSDRERGGRKPRRRRRAASSRSSR